jgi:hypothetical protein
VPPTLFADNPLHGEKSSHHPNIFEFRVRAKNLGIRLCSSPVPYLLCMHIFIYILYVASSHYDDPRTNQAPQDVVISWSHYIDGPWRRRNSNSSNYQFKTGRTTRRSISSTFFRMTLIYLSYQMLSYQKLSKVKKED